MAITERQLDASGQWEVKATGEDIKKLSGMLTQTGNEAYKKSFHRNESVGFQQMVNPRGDTTWIRKDDIQQALDNGYTSTGSIRMMMPEVPWQRKTPKPGKTRYRYDKASGEMIEVL